MKKSFKALARFARTKICSILYILYYTEYVAARRSRAAVASEAKHVKEINNTYQTEGTRMKCNNLKCKHNTKFEEFKATQLISNIIGSSCTKPKKKLWGR